MKDKNKTKIVFLGDDNRLLAKGRMGKVAVYFPDTENAYLDSRIGATPYYYTGHFGVVDSRGEVRIFSADAPLRKYLGRKVPRASLGRLKKHLLHQFDNASCIRKGPYILIDDKAYGFRHTYPYPSQNFILRHYQKFVSSAQLRNFFFDYHAHVLSSSLKRKSLKGLRILDVASGDGSFLATIRKKGASVAGFEPSSSECNEARKKGVVLINDIFNPDKLRGRGKYDVIIAGNILEHVRHPFNFMDKIKKVLKPGGHLFFQVPNDFNPLQERYLKNSGMQAWFICPPEHLNYWNANQAREFVRRCGFKIIHEEAQFPIEFFLLFGLDYRKDPGLGKKAHRMRCNFEKAFAEDKDTLSRIYQKFIEAGIGRDYVAILRLPQ